MIDDQIRELLRVHPFKPFVIALDDGRVLHIESPDRIVFTGSDAGGGWVEVLNDDGTSLIVSLLHVTNVGYFPPAKPEASANP